MSSLKNYFTQFFPEGKFSFFSRHLLKNPFVKFPEKPVTFCTNFFIIMHIVDEFVQFLILFPPFN